MKYAVLGINGWTYHKTLGTARKRAQIVANATGGMVEVNYVSTKGVPIRSETADRIYPQGRKNMSRRNPGTSLYKGGGIGPARPGTRVGLSTKAFIPATGVRLLPGGRIQIKVPRGSVRNPFREVIEGGSEHTAFYNPAGAMFRDQGGVLHPIRSWSGYRGSAVGEGRRKKKAKKAKRAKRTKRVAKRTTRARRRR